MNFYNLRLKLSLADLRFPGYASVYELGELQMRTWHEALDAEGNVRIVRPVTEGEKVHYLFDEKGNLPDNF